LNIDSTLAAVVTGGASGLGRAVVEALRELDVQVAIFDINQDLGSEVATLTGARFFYCDILSEDSVVAAFDAARQAQGQERVLVHCAMLSAGGKTISWDKNRQCYARTPTESFDKSMAGIATSSYRVASIAALGMANSEAVDGDGQRGLILLTSSAAATDGQIGQVAYSGGKGAVSAMVLPMARDLMNIGIRVNAIAPGIFASPPMLKMQDYNPEIFHALGQSVPFPKRLGEPKEFASLALEIIRNNYFNGQCVRLDGALRMPPK